MDCPNCGVYNPEGRTVCWRCDRELPKPEEPKRRRTDSAGAVRRMWIIAGIVLALWILITWLVPWLLRGGPALAP
jgi:hypothetical protein